jgi:hypothetical protein
MLLVQVNDHVIGIERAKEGNLEVPYVRTPSEFRLPDCSRMLTAFRFLITFVKDLNLAVWPDSIGGSDIHQSTLERCWHPSYLIPLSEVSIQLKVGNWFVFGTSMNRMLSKTAQSVLPFVAIGSFSMVLAPGSLKMVAAIGFEPMAKGL